MPVFRGERESKVMMPFPVNFGYFGCCADLAQSINSSFDAPLTGQSGMEKYEERKLNQPKLTHDFV